MFSNNKVLELNDIQYNTLQSDSNNIIMKYLNTHHYNIWEFSFCGMINDLEFGEIFYKENDDGLFIYFRDKITGYIDLYAPPFVDKAKITELTIQELTALRFFNPAPRILRISQDEIYLYNNEIFELVDKKVPLFTIIPKSIEDLSYPHFRRLRRNIANCLKKYGNPILKKYNKKNCDIIKTLRQTWQLNAIDRGITPDSNDAFTWFLSHQEEYGINSYEVYLNNTIKGFISFAPHHDKTCINLFRIADNDFQGLSALGYLESLKMISEKYDIVLDGSGYRKTLYDFKKQFTDIVYNEYSVGLNK